MFYPTMPGHEIVQVDVILPPKNKILMCNDIPLKID